MTTVDQDIVEAAEMLLGRWHENNRKFSTVNQQRPNDEREIMDRLGNLFKMGKPSYALRIVTPFAAESGVSLDALLYDLDPTIVRLRQDAMLAATRAGATLTDVAGLFFKDSTHVVEAIRLAEYRESRGGSGNNRSHARSDDALQHAGRSSR